MPGGTALGTAQTADLDRRARSQAVVVPVPLHLERQPLRVRDRLHGRRRDGLLGSGPATRNTPDPDEYVRIRGDQLRAARRPVRDPRHQRARGDAVPRSRRSSSPSLIRATSRSIPNEGLERPPRSRSACFDARRAPAARARSTTRGRDVADAPRRARSPVRRRLPARTHPRLRQPAHADARRCAPAGPGSPAAAADRLDRLRLLHRQRRGEQSGWRCSRRRSKSQDGHGGWRTRHRGHRLSRSAGRRPSPSISRAGFRARLRAVRIVTNMRIYWDQIARRRSGPAAGSAGDPARIRRRADSALARLLGRSVARRREPYGYDYDRVSSTSPWKLMPGRYTREGDVRPLLARTDDMFVCRAPGDEIALIVRCVAAAAAAGWLDAHLPAPRRRLQQGDGPALGEPGRRSARCRSTA